MNPNQIRPTSLRTSSVQEKPRDTIPPTAESTTLVQIEKIVALRTGKTLLESETWNDDLVITSQDHPELLSRVAQVLGVETTQVTLHFTVNHGVVHQAVFVGGKMSRGRQVNNVLNQINWS